MAPLASVSVNNNSLPSLTYVLPAKAGGIFSFVRALLSHASQGFSSYVIETHNVRSNDALPVEPLPAEHVFTFAHELPPDNLSHALAQLSRLIPPGPGVLVCNDWLELAMLSVHDPSKFVINITHGDYGYYYDLAVRHERVIDRFVAVSERIALELRTRLPHRQNDVLYLPHGVSLPSNRRTPADGPLRAVFLGRLDLPKGVLDLPLIDRLAIEKGGRVRWTIIGDGPQASRLRADWSFNPEVEYTGTLPSEKVAERLLETDVLVLPTRAEGLPITVLEAGAAGVVPIVTGLASGIPEVVRDRITGYQIDNGFIDSFVGALIELNNNRDHLEAMSRAIRQLVLKNFDVTVTSRAYNQLFARYQQRTPQLRFCPLHYGSRLDKPWIPNSVVRGLRTLIKDCSIRHSGTR